MPNSFRAVFSFGPVDDVRRYGPKGAPFDLANAREVRLRSPIYWLGSIRGPVFVFEGNQKPSNLASLKTMQHVTRNPFIHFYTVEGKTHFSTLAAVTPIVARAIMGADSTPISFDEHGISELTGH